MNPLRRLLGPAVFRGRHHARRWRRRGQLELEDASARVAPHAYRQADRLAHLPFRGQRLERPGDELLEDLAAYTGLAPGAVEELVCARSPVDFRAEWHATPAALRSDRWFYLSAKTYLFGNAVHFASEPAVDAVAQLLAPGATVLEFGAGTGNLSIALARRGHTVVADELSALQRDFIRFRTHRHGLDARLSVLDPWIDPPGDSADAVTAFDVLEHLPDGRATLDQRLLAPLRPGGVLIENSPFVTGVANPMHHADWGLDDHLRARGLALEKTTADGSRVWRAS